MVICFYISYEMTIYCSLFSDHSHNIDDEIHLMTECIFYDDLWLPPLAKYAIIIMLGSTNVKLVAITFDKMFMQTQTLCDLYVIQIMSFYTLI